MADVRANGLVGYAWLQRTLELPELLATSAARLANVAAIQRLPEGVILIPQRLDPGNTLLGQVLFALKHEGVNLYLLAHALRRLQPVELLDAFTQTPNGVYLRKACYLWERFNDWPLEVPGSAAITAAYVPMFEPGDYVTGESRRNGKWRVDFNGLGDLGYCPIVRRTAELQAMLREDILAQARAFAQKTSKEMLDRAISWAYLSETEGSFAIEGEIPSQSKAAAFANLLKHADDRKEMTEEYLVHLQNAVITNPLDVAVGFRQAQNRLQGPGMGAVGVTYVPPAPVLSTELMHHWLALTNRSTGNPAIHPLVNAAVASFGFVFIHPFMDGNGRLSRFLIHHCLGQSAQLPKGFLLPISVAMKRNEQAYLDALRSFSRPARDLCEVTWLGHDDYVYDWAPDAHHAFRYIDMTRCVEFTLQMAKIALEEDLRRETEFLIDFDRVHKTIDSLFDIRGSDLSLLITMAFQNGGVLSKNRRKQFGDRVQWQALDAIEAEVRKCCQERGEQGAAS